MTYTVLSGTLNSTIPYHTICVCIGVINSSVQPTPAAAATARGICSIHSRAHITLGHSASTQPVQSGDDLLDVLRLDARRSQVAGPITVGDGSTLRYYGDGRCFVEFARPQRFSALFSPNY